MPSKRKITAKRAAKPAPVIVAKTDTVAAMLATPAPAAPVAPTTGKAKKPAPPPLPVVNVSYAGASTCDTKRAAAIFERSGRAFSNYTHRTDSYLRDLRDTYKRDDFAGAGRDKAVVEIAIYSGLVTLSDAGRIAFTDAGFAFTDAASVVPNHGDKIPYASLIESRNRAVAKLAEAATTS